MSRSFILAAGALFAALSHGQVRPQFEVASLKPAGGTPNDTPGQIFINLGTARNGEVTLGNACLNDCLRFAYGITSDSQIAGPEWTRDKRVRFDIMARATPETPRETLLVMLQNLLTERFRLQLHREPRELSHYVLTQAKGGSKMREASGNPTPHTNSPGHIQHERMSMTMLGSLLARFELRLPVLDLTGLSGVYQVDLKWSPDIPGGQPGPEASPFPSLYRALPEQLGLRLESRKGPVEVLVIDAADRVPIAN